MLKDFHHHEILHSQPQPTPFLMMKRTLATLAFSLTAALALHAAAPARLEVKKDDHIAIVGNALADRMQHDGTLEAFIHKAHPQEDISIRNLGFAADEITSHMRSDAVPTTDTFLEMV